MTAPCARPRTRGWSCRRGVHPPGTPCALVPSWFNRSRYARACRRVDGSLRVFP